MNNEPLLKPILTINHQFKISVNDSPNTFMEFNLDMDGRVP